MAVQAITPIVLTPNTASADHADADSQVVTDTTLGWSVAAANIGRGRLVLFKFVDDGSGSTVTINAGDNPPAMTQGLGNITVTLAASDVKYICLEAARVTQSDGTITGTCTDAGMKMSVLVLPNAV